MGQNHVETRLREYFASRDDDVLAAWLFGSTARGTATRESDVDVGVLFSKSPLPVLTSAPFRIEDELERLLNREVQVVVLNTAPPDLVHRVLRDGHLLVDGDHDARVIFEMNSRNEYFDLLPHLERYRGIRSTMS